METVLCEETDTILTFFYVIEIYIRRNGHQTAKKYEDLSNGADTEDQKKTSQYLR